MPRFSNPSTQSAASSSVPFHTRKRGHGSGGGGRKKKKSSAAVTKPKEKSAFAEDEPAIRSGRSRSRSRSSGQGKKVTPVVVAKSKSAITKTVASLRVSSNYTPQKVIVKEKGKSPAKKTTKKSSSPCVAPTVSTPEYEDESFLLTTYNSHSSTPAVLPPPVVLSKTMNRAVAVDTRALQTFSGDAASRMFLTHVRSLLRVLFKRGATPPILASLTSSSSSTTTSTTSTRSPRIKNSSSRVSIGTHASILDSTLMETLLSLQTATTKNNQNHPASNTQTKNKNSISPTMLDQVPIRAPLNIANSKNRKAVHVPKALLANDSWKLFGDLVEAILVKSNTKSKQVGPDANRNNGNDDPPPPLDITILTNDIALFTDSKEQSHKSGLEAFWKAMESKFHDNNKHANHNLRSIDIVVVETGVVALEKEESMVGGMGSSSSSLSPSQDSNESSSSSSSSSWSDPLRSHSSSSSSTQLHLVNVAQCIRQVKSQLFTLSERKRYGSTGTTTTTASSRRSPNPVRIQLSTMENNSIEYQKLVRQWILHTMSLEKGNIRFDLPETMDGTQCSVSLDLSYKVMPFRVDSHQMAGLLTDMKILSQSPQFQVVQLIPISTIDASLLFGVPMAAQAALTSDLPTYREMQLLVKCLLSYFVEKDLALLLRSMPATTNDDDDNDNNNKPSPISDHDSPLYRMEDETFLLMAEELPNYQHEQQQQQGNNQIKLPQNKEVVKFSEVPSLSEKVNHYTSTKNTTNNWKPSNGVLYRYATSEQILLDRPCGAKTTQGSGGSSDGDYNEDTEKQYVEYIDSSLDFLDRHPINPLYAGAKEMDARHTKEEAEKNTLLFDESMRKIPHENNNNSEPEWTDDCGVGARESPCSSQSSREESKGQQHDSDSNDNNMLDDFYYS